MKKEILIVVLLSLAMTVATTIKFFSQYATQPPNHQFIGVTHYFEDFYYYLDQFYQGSSNIWMARNRFTSEKLPPSLIYFNNIMLGKIGGLFNLESYQSYNYSLIILKFAFFLASYLVLVKIFPDPRNRLLAFLIFLFSTALTFTSVDQSGTKTINPRFVWGAKNLVMSRFGNVPDRYMINLETIGILLLAASAIKKIKKMNNAGKQETVREANNTPDANHFVHQLLYGFKQIGFYLLGLTLMIPMLAIGDGAVCLIVIGSSLFTILMSKLLFSGKTRVPAFLLVAAIGLSFSIIGLYLYRTIEFNPIYKQAVAWDVEQYRKQFTILRPSDIIFSFAPIGTILLLGLPFFLKKKKNQLEKMIGISLLISVAGYIIPYVFRIDFPGNRFISAISYLAASIIGLHAFLFLDHLLKKKIHISSLYLLILVYLAINMNTFKISLLNELQPVKEPEYHFTYLPNSLYQSLVKLSTLGKNGEVVLASPWSSMDLIIPGLTGKRTYSGHFLVTLDATSKDKQADDFFMKSVDSAQTRQFIRSNNIKYVFSTSYENKTVELKKYYPFLKVYYENDMATIFTVDYQLL